MNPQGYADRIVQTVREPLLVLDGELRVAAANRAFNSSFHTRPEESAGHLLYELGDGQWDIPALRKMLADVLLSNSEFKDYEVAHDFPHIGHRTMLLNARQLHDGGMNAKLILLAIEDITEQRQEESEVVQQQRTWFQTALGSIGDGVIATDAEARITFMNPTAAAMTGWTQHQAIGKPLDEVFHIINEGTRKSVENSVAKVVRDGAMVGLANHTLLISRDGSEHPIDDSASPIRDERKKTIIGVVMVFHDISGRRAAEQKLHQSEVRYRRLFESAHDGILILDSTTRTITDVNPFLIELLSFPREYFMGKELWEIGIFKDKDANQAAMQQLYEKGSIRFEDLPLQDRNGHRHPVEIVANIYQEDRTPVIQCNIRDIGERAQFERERGALLANEQASRMEAEAANRSKDLFLATLSHEVRTPLNAIMGWASILRGGKADEATIKEGMEVIERSCKSQAQLIEDVLDISRIVSGQLRLEICKCKLVDVINAAIEVVRPAAEAKQITIETELDPAASETSCDMSRMQQVVWNLLTNAIKFSPKGTVVRVALTLEKPSVTRIQVIDQGKGISRAFMPFVFDRFRQGDGSTKRRVGGLGLGLSIVKYIVEMHGGTVRAESGGTGSGATFTVNLPVRAVQLAQGDCGSRDESVDPVAPPELKPVRLDGLRVMMVDDEADARRLLGKVLGDAGGIVTAVGSVAEAMLAVAAANPQVLLSDIAMPDEDGYDLIRKMRKAGRSAKEMPAVALTAFAHKDDRLRVLRAGFQVHVAKPIDPYELLAIVASLTGRTG